MTNSTRNEWINLTASDRHNLSAFCAHPAEPSQGNIIVIQEIFGVNAHIRSVALSLASKGYTTLAPALFDRAKKGIELAYDETGMQEGIALKNQINWENALKDIQAGIEYFGTNNPVAVMGFCWGGTLAWLSATRLSVSGSICYYAGQLKNFLDETPRSPVLAHFGENDHSIPLTVPATLKERYPGVINHIYLDAGHGFNCNERESYNPKASKKAMQRSLGFLESIF